jgi:hypothetical protein
VTVEKLQKMELYAFPNLNPPSFPFLLAQKKRLTNEI